MAMLPILGLDGVSGIGGSFIYDENQYDSLMHVHLLLGKSPLGHSQNDRFGTGRIKARTMGAYRRGFISDGALEVRNNAKNAHFDGR